MNPTIELRPASLKAGEFILIVHKWRNKPRNGPGTWPRNTVQVNACHVLGPADPNSPATQNARQAVQP